MTTLPDEIHIQSLGGQKPMQAQLQEAITDFEQAGFTFTDAYCVAEFPAVVLVGMINDDQSIVAGIQLADPQQPVVCEVSTYFQDGTSITVNNMASHGGEPEHPSHKMIYVNNASATQLLARIQQERPDKPHIILSADNLPKLGEATYRDKTAFSKTGDSNSSTAKIDEDAVVDKLDKLDSLSTDSEDNADALMDMMGDIENMSDDQFLSVTNRLADETDDDDDQEDANEYSDIEDDDDSKEIKGEASTLKQLTEALQKLESWWQQNDPELLAQLNPGCDIATFKAAKQKLGKYSLPQDIVMLYQWHNGHDDLSVDIGTGRPFAPLAEALLERETMLDALGEEVWNPAWLPVFGEADEGLFVILTTRAQPNSSLFYYNIQSDPITLRYNNAQGMIQTILEGYQKKILLPIKDQPSDYYKVYYDDKLDEVRKKHNPSAYPFFKKQGKTYLYFEQE